MDLFAKIDQFEKMANDLADQLEDGMAQDAETISNSDEDRSEKRARSKARLKKLASLLKR